jgi:2,3-dihydroxyphenylpropionate 1,2-dioxygenase
MTTLLTCASHSPLLYCYDKEPDDWEGLQSAYAERVRAIEEFDPDLVFAFGADHFNGFFLKLMPSFCIGLDAEAVGDIGGFAGPLAVPKKEAAEAVRQVRAADVDIAVSYKMTIDHGFSQTINNMLGGLAARPTIPVFINCIAPPLVPFRRSRLLGEAIGKYAQSLDRKVLFLASGGMSHHPTRYYPEIGEGSDDVAGWQMSGGEDPDSLSPQQWIDRLEEMHIEGAKMITRGERTAEHMRLNAAADARFLEVLTGGDLRQFDGWSPEEVVQEAGIGSMELHTWIAATAAHLAAGGERPQTDFYSVAPELGIAAGIVHAGTT